MEERTFDDDIGNTIVVKKKKDGNIELDDGMNEETDIQSLNAELDGGEEKNEEAEEVVFDIPSDLMDNEELADMTPEEARAFLNKRAEEQALIKEKTDKLMAEAFACEESGDYERAEELCYNAIEADPFHLEANVKYARFYTKDFSDYSDFSLVKETYERGVNNCGDAFVAAVKDGCGENIQSEISRLQTEADEIEKNLKEKQQKRRTAFKADMNAKMKHFFFALISAIVCLVAAVIFTSLIASVEGYVFLVLACVFGGAALILIVVTLVLTNKLVNAVHRVRENERLGSTKDGRALIAVRSKIGFLKDAVK